MSKRSNLKLLQGTVNLLILRTLAVSGLQHGYGIANSIHARTGGELGLEESALYHALHRLESRGLVSSEWGVSDNNRRAKFYKITGEGRRQLREESRIWTRYARAVFAVLEPA